jgi:hypothetical protein
VTFDLDLSVDVLRRSPATLRALLDGLGAPWVPFLPVLSDHMVPRS